MTKDTTMGWFGLDPEPEQLEPVERPASIT